MNITYSPRVEESEKDIVISQLKAQVFELQQNEKNFNSLSLKVRSLQNDANILSEEKLRLEYELKQRSEMSDKQILELRQANENLQLELSEKVQVNKKLFADNNSFYRVLEARNAEINDLKAQINSLIDENSVLREKTNELESQNIGERNNSAAQRNQIDILNRELDKAGRNINELSELLKNTQSEKTSSNIKLEETKREAANLNAQLKRKEDNLIFASKQIDELNSSCQAFKSKILEGEKKAQQLTSELNQLTGALNAEKNLRSSVEKSNNQVEALLNEKEKENRKLFADNTELRSQYDRVSLDAKILGNEIEKLKEHIIVLTQQNQIVIPINLLC